MASYRSSRAVQLSEFELRAVPNAPRGHQRQHQQERVFRPHHPRLPPLNDNVWDLVTINAYEGFLQAKVFQPSGVVDATLDHPPGCALAYRGPDDTEPGWNSGALQQSCGCDGWHLSVNELLDVMGEFRRGNGILTPADAQTMLDNGFGVDPLTGNSALPAALNTLAGNLYCKPGDWHDPKQPGRTKPRVFLAGGYGAGGVR